MSTPRVEVRRLLAEDLERLAELHRRAFPASVLGRLGTEAVVRYYQWQLLGPHEVEGLVAVDGGRLLGFLVGGRFRGSMIGFVKRHARFLVVQVARHPTLLVSRRGLRAVAVASRLLAWRSPGARVERPDRVPAESFGVLVVAVAPEAHRLGVGRLLVGEAEQTARQAGYERMHLTVDPHNGHALTFYRELGWRRLGLPGDTSSAWLMGKEILP